MSALDRIDDEQALTPSDLARFSRLESVIEDGLATFVKVGEALLEIRSQRLYRDDFDSFEDYCQKRWDFSKQYAHLIIAEAQVNQLVDAPLRQSHARELVPLLSDPEEVRAVVEEVRERHSEPTAADVREVVQGRMGVHYSSTTDQWSTPQDLFDELDSEFAFTLDVCATPDNAKCAAFFTPKQDGLEQDWRGTCWMNPPYGDAIARWVEKAYMAAKEGATVVCLVPARVDTGWWWNYCRYGEIRFLRGRLRFGGGENAAPFPSAVVVFGRATGVIWWERVT